MVLNGFHPDTHFRGVRTAVGVTPARGTAAVFVTHSPSTPLQPSTAPRAASSLVWPKSSVFRLEALPGRDTQNKPENSP